MSEIEHNNRPFQSAFRLQTHRPSARSALIVAAAAPTSHKKQPPDAATSTTTSVPSEARYWAEKFGLGANSNSSSYSRSRGKYAHPRAVTLQCGTTPFFVQQIVLGATATATDARRAPHQLLAVLGGPRVPLFGVTPQADIHKLLGLHSLSYDTTRTVAAADRNVPTGGQLALAAALRSDGRLLAIGTANGTLRVADTTTRATLCQFSLSTVSSSSSNNNNLGIRAVAWFRDGQHLMSAGDDGVVRVWALMKSTTSNSNKPILELRGHGDSIRCAVLWQAAASTSGGSLVASGGYDHTVRIWNVDNIINNDNKTSQENATSNNERCRFVLQHGAPVEALSWISSTAKEDNNTNTCPIWLVSAGGTSLKVWNPVTGRCVCTLQAQHRKSITSLLQLPRVNRDEEGETTTTQQQQQQRLITGGLDGLLRIHNWDTATGQLQYLHGVRVENGTVGITALAATTGGDRIAIGTTAGTVLVRQMGPSGPQRNKRTISSSGGPRAGTYAFFRRGMNAEASAGDHVVQDENVSGSNKRRKPMHSFDVALQQFRYGDALDVALETRQPPSVAAVLEELGRRPNGLTIALSNRDEESLEPLLAFTARYIARPRYSALLIGVANHLLDIYGDVAGESETMDELLNKLKNQVSTEVKTQMLLWRLVGQLDSVLTEAERLER